MPDQTKKRNANLSFFPYGQNSFFFVYPSFTPDSGWVTHPYYLAPKAQGLWFAQGREKQLGKNSQMTKFYGVFWQLKVFKKIKNIGIIHLLFPKFGKLESFQFVFQFLENYFSKNSKIGKIFFQILENEFGKFPIFQNLEKANE